MRERTRRVKPKKTGTWRNLLILGLLFVLSAIVTFFYLKPKVTLKSQFMEYIKTRRPLTKPVEDEKNSIELYKYPKELSGENNERMSLLSKAEETVKKYMHAHGIKLLDLYMDNEGTIYIDLSDDLRKRFNGDISEEYQLISGLFKNIKSSVPNLRSLKILMEGKEVESFGGHIDISKPISEEIENPSGENIEKTI